MAGVSPVAKYKLVRSLLSLPGIDVLQDTY